MVLKCQHCGEDFLYEFSGRGAKARYCEKCKHELNRQSHQKYNDKIKLGNVENKATTTEEQKSFTDKIGELLTRLDTLRVELCDLAKQMSEYQSSYDKNDQTYLHKLENVDIENAEELQQMVKEWKLSRNNRRNVKDLLTLVGNTIDCIPYKNYANALPILKSRR